MKIFRNIENNDLICLTGSELFSRFAETFLSPPPPHPPPDQVVEGRRSQKNINFSRSIFADCHFYSSISLVNIEESSRELYIPKISGVQHSRHF